MEETRIMPISLEGLCHLSKDPRLVERLPLLLASWELAYPGLDYQDEVRRAHAWLASHDKRRTNMCAFLNNWLKKSYLDLLMDKQMERRHAQRRQEERRRGEEPLARIKKDDREWVPDMSAEEMAEIRRRNMGR